VLQLFTFNSLFDTSQLLPCFRGAHSLFNSFKNRILVVGGRRIAADWAAHTGVAARIVAAVQIGVAVRMVVAAAAAEVAVMVAVVVHTGVAVQTAAGAVRTEVAAADSWEGRHNFPPSFQIDYPKQPELQAVGAGAGGNS